MMWAKQRFYTLPTKIRVIALAGMLVSFLIFLTSCDGSLNITGTVYELVDAPPTAHSEVYVDRPLPDNIRLILVESANVTVTPKSWFNKSSNLNVGHTITDADGDFKTGGLADPSKNTYVIVINKVGYLEASAEFVSPSKKKYVSPTDNGSTHTILVVLVRDPSNSTH
jgi:hypothetical protein